MCKCANVQMCRCADEIDNLSNYKLKFNLMLHFEQLTPAFAHLHICILIQGFTQSGLPTSPVVSGESPG